MKKKNFKREKGLFWPIALLCVLLVGNLIFTFFYFGIIDFNTGQDIYPESRDVDLSLNETDVLSLEGFVEIDIEIFEESGVLISKEDRCQGLVVAIDPVQAYSIQQGIDSRVSFRPTSHDTARDILEQYGVDVIMVKITDIRSGAYLGRMVLQNEEKIVNLDVRPSDGVAIAVRTDSPIYLSNSLLEDHGENIC